MSKSLLHCAVSLAPCCVDKVDQDMPGRLKSPPSTILAFLYLRRTLDIESSTLWIMSSLDLGGL